ncbi:MAG: TolB family protein [Flavobacteriales bacterium]
MTACSQKVDDHLKYLAQEPPSLSPKVFAPGLISKEAEYEFGSVFTEDATEFFYGVDVNGKSEIRYTSLTGTAWNEPQTILSHEEYGYNDPFLSPDENRLYFISKMSLDRLSSKKDHDIWYVQKEGNKWSEPINAGPNINSNRNEYYISFTQTGTMYFSSDKITSEKKQNNFDIYSSISIDGEFQKAIALSDSINTGNYEADVFVDPEETYIIFCARRPEGLGKGDLYVSFKNNDGTWTKSINMGEKINTKDHELCPFVSKDGKYLFYTSNQDIYWVSSKIIDELKKSI